MQNWTVDKIVLYKNLYYYESKLYCTNFDSNNLKFCKGQNIDIFVV